MSTEDFDGAIQLLQLSHASGEYGGLTQACQIVKKLQVCGTVAGQLIDFHTQFFKKIHGFSVECGDHEIESFGLRIIFQFPIFLQRKFQMLPDFPIGLSKPREAIILCVEDRFDRQFLYRSLLKLDRICASNGCDINQSLGYLYRTIMVKTSLSDDVAVMRISSAGQIDQFFHRAAFTP